MLTKSYTTEQYVKRFGKNITIKVTGSSIKNQRLNDFLNANNPIEALEILRIADMSPQVFKCPASFTDKVKNLFNEYKNLTIKQLLNKKFINCFTVAIYIDPTNLKGGLVLDIIDDGVNKNTHDNYTGVGYIKGSFLYSFESYGTDDGGGIFIQEALRSTLTGTDYKAFKDLKEVLEQSDKHPPKPFFYKLSMDDISDTALIKFQVRCTKWLDKNLEAFVTKRGAETFHLLQVRSTVGLPKPKVGMKVFKGVKDVTGVAFYID